MKILTLHFKNLNSLKGEWLIDFTKPQFAQEGVFAILGKTGAGKTTILDAICLAIYGQTPRIKTISNTQNELMSTNTADCLAQVELQMDDGLYRFFWGQRRANKKSDGKLQAIKREIIKIKHLGDDDGEILETKSSLCDKLACQILHMNFEQFTRSVMLAQGNFSAFLKADANEKGEILEQITGTHIYGQISIKAYEIDKQKRTQLQELTSKIDADSLMSGDEFAQLESQLQQYRQSQNTQQNALSAMDSTIKHLEQINHHKQNIAKLSDELSIHQQAFDEFEPDRQRLALAMKADKVLPAYHKYNDISLQLQKTQQQLTESQNTLPTLQQELQLATKKQQGVKQQFDQISQSYTQQLPLFQKVRHLDLQLSECHKKQQALSDGRQHTTQELQQRQQSLQHKRQQLSELNQTLSHLEHQQQQHDGEKLYAQISTLNNARPQLTQMFAQLCSLEQDKSALSQKQEIKREEFRQLKPIDFKVSKEGTEIINAIQKILGKYGIGAGLDEHQILEQAQHLTHIAHTYDKLIENIKLAHAQHRQQIQRLTKLDDLQAKQISTDSKIAQYIQLVSKTQEQLDDKRQLFETLKQSALQEQELHILKNRLAKLNHGEPCPLCGSTDHPFKAQPQTHSHFTDNLQQQLSNSEMAVESALNELHSHQEQLSILQVQAEHLKAQISDLSTPSQFDDIISNINQLQQQLNLPPISKDSLPNTDEMTCIYHQIIADIKQYQHLHTLKLCLDEGLILNEEINQYQNKIDQCQTDIKGLLEHCQLNIATDEQPTQAWQTHTHQHLDQALALLNQQYQQHKSHAEQKQRLDQDKMTLSLQIERLQEQLHSAEQALSQLEQEWQSHQQNLLAYQQQRRDIFGDGNPDEQEQSLQNQQHTLQQQLNEAQHAISTLDAQIKQRLELIDRYHQDVQNLNELSAQHRQDFTQILYNQGFTDSEHLLSCVLDDGDKATLSTKQDSLSYQLKKTQENLGTHQAQLQALQASKQVDGDLDQLIADRQQLQDKQNSLLQNIGKCEQQHQDAIKQRQHHQQLTEQIQQKRKDIEIWSKINELIGSSDGKKYRNFVQGLTLEIMLYHANQVLQRMSERYVLTHINDKHTKSMLEIGVIDTQQGNEQRSTKNLSGGETFIISLALAIGLSKMNSEKTNINSLFLDEGFGTLDDDALDIALNTLASLHSEGKTIGIISHVATLKERIGTQIWVQPQGNGTSRLSGSGIKNI